MINYRLADACANCTHVHIINEGDGLCDDLVLYCGLEPPPAWDGQAVKIRPWVAKMNEWIKDRRVQADGVCDAWQASR